ncbi:MAG TPA: LysM peptidoglycan-binding domain-containing protein [Chthoniobacterales bacterium]|nr:LysM peptidoglycan-binding domain-containing protein [Chthoniobacterales bacterium]
MRGSGKKKLRASTARRSFGDDEIEEMAEPNMKLSRALLIVLVLHVVAVAGIIAFNTIKSRQGAFPPPTGAKKSEAAQPTPASTAAPGPAAVAAKAGLPEATTIPRALPVNNSDTSANTYTVVKGDNPVKIAKKLKVSESELLRLNQIDDPRKLKIGQKLIIPPKKTASKAKKANE